MLLFKQKKKNETLVIQKVKKKKNIRILLKQKKKMENYSESHLN